MIVEYSCWLVTFFSTIKCTYIALMVIRAMNQTGWEEMQATTMAKIHL